MHPWCMLHISRRMMVSCSCFAPTPSMAAMLVNRFKFKESVLTYNL